MEKNLPQSAKKSKIDLWSLKLGYDHLERSNVLKIATNADNHGMFREKSQ